MKQRVAKRLRRRTAPAGLAEQERAFVHDDIVRGIEAKKVKDLIDCGVLDAKRVFRVIPERTFNRRLANRELLKVPEADAIARLLRVIRMAERMLDDAPFARRWLDLPESGVEKSHSDRARRDRCRRAGG